MSLITTVAKLQCMYYVLLAKTYFYHFQLQHEVISTHNGFRMDLMKKNKAKKLLGATFITPVNYNLFIKYKLVPIRIARYDTFDWLFFRPILPSPTPSTGGPREPLLPSRIRVSADPAGHSRLPELLRDSTSERQENWFPLGIKSLLNKELIIEWEPRKMFQ